MAIKELHSVHFIGIGGISMSALAHILLREGAFVSGSDCVESPITSRLAEAGADIKIGHSEKNILSPELVVYTAAISEDNPELVKARKMGIKTLERADFLGEMMKSYNFPIAVSGTHGKTTTTAMLSCVLLNAGLNPTVLVGGELSRINGNYHVGSTKYLVFEACEYVDSFLKFNPFAAIVLNIDEDHLDYFGGIDNIAESFKKFMQKLPEDGFAVLNSEDENSMKSARDISCRKVYYGSNGEYKASDITVSEDGTIGFTLRHEKFTKDIKLGVKGLHNVSNALAVFAAAHNLGLEPDDIAKGIESFNGTKRRFEYKGEVFGASVYDDYAHHPAEIEATLNTARNIRHNKIWCIFQPHTYSRTRALFDGFVNALSKADMVIITDIYAAREPSDGKTNAKMLAEKIKGAVYISDFCEIAEYIKANVSKNDIVLTMGAGTVTDISAACLIFREGCTERTCFRAPCR